MFNPSLYLLGLKIEGNLESSRSLWPGDKDVLLLTGPYSFPTGDMCPEHRSVKGDDNNIRQVKISKNSGQTGDLSDFQRGRRTESWTRVWRGLYSNTIRQMCRKTK